MNGLTGPVPEGWQELPLAKVCDVAAGPSNSMIRPVATGGVSVEIVAPKNLQHGRIASSSSVQVTEEASARLRRYQLAPGDVVCVRTGDLTKQALARVEHEGWVVGTACFRLRPTSTVDSKYLLSYLRHPVVRDWVARHASTATVPTLTSSTLSALPVLVPPIAKQVAIGEIMGALDEKVTLHREIVAVTEDMRESLLPLLLANR